DGLLPPRPGSRTAGALHRRPPPTGRSRAGHARAPRTERRFRARDPAASPVRILTCTRVLRYTKARRTGVASATRFLFCLCSSGGGRATTMLLGTQRVNESGHLEIG